MSLAFIVLGVADAIVRYASSSSWLALRVRLDLGLLGFMGPLGFAWGPAERSRGFTAAGGSGSSPGEVTVKVPRERKLRKFTGVRDDHLIEDWILDTKRGISSQSEADAVDFLLYHLQGAAKEELRLRPDEEKNTPEALSRVLRSSFGEGRISTQAMRKFFERRERERESVQHYSHSLMVLLSRVENLNPGAVTDKDQLLRDQFLENLYDPQLRSDIKRWARDHSAKSFQQIREEVHR